MIVYLSQHVIPIHIEGPNYHIVSYDIFRTWYNFDNYGYYTLTSCIVILFHIEEISLLRIMF